MEADNIRIFHILSEPREFVFTVLFKFIRERMAKDCADTSRMGFIVQSSNTGILP